METQVLIIGGGAAGTMMARELSKYKVDVTLVEKKPDVGFGISKASNGYIYFGMAWNVSIVLKSVAEQIGGVTKGSEIKKENWNKQGAQMWQSILNELDIPFLWTPVMQLATNEHELKLLNRIEEETISRGLPYRKLNKEEILSIEPHVTPDVIAGLYDDISGWKHTYPWETVVALTENAQHNGVKIMLNTEVIGFSRKNGFQVVETTKGPIKTEFIINATGADGLEIARMADALDFSLQYFKAHVILTDKRVRNLVNTSVAVLAGPGRLKSINPVQSGNLLLSSIYTNTRSPHDLSTDRNTLDELFGMAKDVVPELSKRDLISYFATSRIYSARDPDEYIIEFAPKNPRFITMILRMPGFIPLPAIAKDILGMLADHGLSLTLKDTFDPHRKRIPRFSDLSNEERNKLIAQNPRYGHVVCRCETVTEGEIVEAIRRGATTLDGVKFRTRAGMGRCQSGFCGPRVVEILARELNIKPTDVTKNGGNSRQLLYESKTLRKLRESVKV
jgi:glycerol-3-phosphate dehydrogenase